MSTWLIIMNFTRTTHYKKNGVTYQLVTDRFDNFVSERALGADEIPKAVIYETLDDFLAEADVDDTMYVSFAEAMKPLLQEGVTHKKVWDIFTNYESALMARTRYKLHVEQKSNILPPQAGVFPMSGRPYTSVLNRPDVLTHINSTQEPPITNAQYTSYHAAVFQQGECPQDLPGCAEVVESYKKEMESLGEGCAQCSRQAVRNKYEKLIRKKLGI
jgi:hypothetical protein